MHYLKQNGQAQNVPHVLSVHDHDEGIELVETMFRTGDHGTSRGILSAPKSSWQLALNAYSDNKPSAVITL